MTSKFIFHPILRLIFNNLNPGSLVDSVRVQKQQYDFTLYQDYHTQAFSTKDLFNNQYTWTYSWTDRFRFNFFMDAG